MDKKDIEDLIAVMDRSSLAEIEIADGDTKIILRKHQQPQTLPQPTPTFYPTLPSAFPGPFPATFQNPAPTALPNQTLPNAAVEPEGPSVACENLYVIKSPMVGTFYSAPSPDSDPFVHVGSTIEKDSPICILEAMKVMNEIQSDVAGIIREILVKNGQPIEFGQPLFKVEISNV